MENIENIVKPKSVSNENSKNVYELVFPPEKRREMLNELRQSF